MRAEKARAAGDQNLASNHAVPRTKDRFQALP
jgi:hypothetical protein